MEVTNTRYTAMGETLYQVQSLYLFYLERNVPTTLLFYTREIVDELSYGLYIFNKSCIIYNGS